MQRLARLLCAGGLSLVFLLVSLWMPAGLALAEPASSTTGSTVPVDPVDPALAAQRLERISENCTSIKQSLTQLQRADSRTRTYLGSSYETIANSFIAPINLRLIKNNHPDPTLITIQTDFFAAQTDFRNQYTAYMRDLEALIGTDCQSRPEEFSTRLDTARNSRAILQESTQRLSKLIDDQGAAVQQLQEELHE